MIFTLSMIGSFVYYFAMIYFHDKQSTIYVAITTALMVLTISLMGMYIQNQNDNIKELKSPCPEYEKVEGLYKRK